jgi:hypothetical protein
MTRTYDYDFATGTLRDEVRGAYWRDSRSSRREIVERLDKLATLLDTALVIPGTNIRFGADALVGLVPVLAMPSPPSCRATSCTRRTGSARRLT